MIINFLFLKSYLYRWLMTISCEKLGIIIWIKNSEKRDNLLYILLPIIITRSHRRKNENKFPFLPGRGLLLRLSLSTTGEEAGRKRWRRVLLQQPHRFTSCHTRWDVPWQAHGCLLLRAVGRRSSIACITTVCYWRVVSPLLLPSSDVINNAEAKEVSTIHAKQWNKSKGSCCWKSLWVPGFLLRQTARSVVHFSCNNCDHSAHGWSRDWSRRVVVGPSVDSTSGMNKVRLHAGQASYILTLSSINWRQKGETKCKRNSTSVGNYYLWRKMIESCCSAALTCSLLCRSWCLPASPPRRGQEEIPLHQNSHLILRCHPSHGCFGRGTVATRVD